MRSSTALIPRRSSAGSANGNEGVGNRAFVAVARAVATFATGPTSCGPATSRANRRRNVPVMSREIEWRGEFPNGWRAMIRAARDHATVARRDCLRDARDGHFCRWDLE